MLINLSIFLLYLSIALGDEGQKSYEGWSLIKVQAVNQKQVDYLNSLPGDLSNGELQIWQPGTETRPFDIFISPEAKTRFLASLNDRGIKYEIKSQNIQRAIDAEKIPALRNRAMSARDASWFTRFLKIDEIYAAIDKLAQENPSIVSVETIGQGHKGRPIQLVKVTSNQNSNKPGIWIDGGIHAREWIAPSTVLYMLNKLVTGYKTNSNYTQYIDGATWYFIVVVNPDGYEYSHTKNRMWRKNRRPGRQCEGVDLNRNFDMSFGGAGTSSNPCDDIYRGPSAFSEPESRAVRDYVLSHKDIKAVLTLHSYSQMWFVPYGDLKNHYAPDYTNLKRIADAGAKALARRYGTSYQVGTAANLLYEAAGGSDDWSKAKAKIEYVYCLELRPGANAANGFILSPSKIIEVGEETWEGIQIVVNAVLGKRTPNNPVFGLLEMLGPGSKKKM